VESTTAEGNPAVGEEPDVSTLRLLWIGRARERRREPKASEAPGKALSESGSASTRSRRHLRGCRTVHSERRQAALTAEIGNHVRRGQQSDAFRVSIQADKVIRLARKIERALEMKAERRDCLAGLLTT
jgi:hypothetical protein